MNTIGKQATLTLFGESHGRAIGCVLDGLPSGEAIELEQVKKTMPLKSKAVISMAIRQARHYVP